MIFRKHFNHFNEREAMEGFRFKIVHSLNIKVSSGKNLPANFLFLVTCIFSS